MQFRAYRKLQNMATTSKSRRNKRKDTDSSGVDLVGLPPWYLLTYSHGTPLKNVCSHLYIYGDTAVYGPDVTVCVEYDSKSDNTSKVPKITVERHGYN